MNVDINSTVQLVLAIISSHLGKIPAGLLLFWPNFVIKQLLFTQTATVLEWLLEGREKCYLSHSVPRGRGKSAPQEFL